jgi:hypothetical protein
VAKTSNYQVAGTFDVSTTGTINDLDFQSCAVIRMTNATLATLTGLKAGYPGQMVTIVATGAGQVNLSHQNAGSAAANRLINAVTSAVTSLAAGVGAATYTYDDTTARWRLVDPLYNLSLTTQAFRLSYDATDFADLTIASNGNVSLAATGSIGSVSITPAAGGAIFLNGATNFATNVTGNKVVTFGPAAPGDAAALLMGFLFSNAQKNWQLSANAFVGGAMQFTPSTVAGGGTFTTPVFTLVDTGVTVNGVTTFQGPARLQAYTVATLPAGVAGYIAYCTDLLAPAFLAIAVGGGAVVGVVFYNGANWVSI